METVLYGKSKVTEYFNTARKNNALGHLYILYGDKGVGKMTTAKYVSCMLHCGKDVPCTFCSHCKKHIAGSHPDFKIICDEKDGERLPASVKTVREAVEDMIIKPFSSDKKIYIIPFAENLRAESQNALLKVFEEPPEYVIIFLLTNSKNAVLPTVLSRGVLIEIPPCDRKTAEQYIDTHYKTPQRDIVLLSAGGNIGKIKDFCENEDFLKRRRSILSAFTSLSGDREKAFDLIDCVLGEKGKEAEAVSLFYGVLRDVLAKKTGNRILNSDFEKEINTLADFVTENGIVSATKRADEFLKYYSKGSNTPLWITELICKCWEDFHGTDSGR